VPYIKYSTGIPAKNCSGGAFHA